MQKGLLKARLLMVISAAAIIPLAGLSNIIIVENHQPRAVVVTADDPSLTAEYAAEELVHHVELATGVRLDIVPESKLPEEPAGRIFVGVCQAARTAGINWEKLALEVSLLRVIDEDLFILGRENEEAPLSRNNTHAGTLFGVYELLEKTLQVRWLWPGELGTHVPRTSTVKVSSELDKLVEPVFNPRHITLESIPGDYFSSNEARNVYRHDLNVYLRRHRIGRSYVNPECPCHFLRSLYDYARENPDDAPWHRVDEKERESLCVSHPELHEMIVDRHDQFDSRRIWREFEDGRIHVMLGDLDSAWHPCQCQECIAWDGPLRKNGPVNPATGQTFEKGFYQRFGRFHTADRYARFAKTIYKMTRERNPEAEVKVSTLLYWNNLFAPTSDIKLNSDIFGYFCPWGTGLEGTVWFPIGDKALEWKKQQWLGWLETGMSLIHRPNHWFGGYVMPHIERQGGEFFKWAYEHEMTSFYYTRLLGDWATQGRNIYMYMRLFVHPEMEIDDILAEYYNAFGPATEQIRRYFEYWEAYARKRHEPLELPPGLMIGEDYKLAQHVYPLDPAPLQQAVAAAADAFPVKKFAPAEKILEKAMKAARQDSNPVYAERVEFLQLGLEHARLTSRFFDTLEVHSAIKAKIPGEPEERRAAVRAFEELETFRHRHGDSYIANFGNALRRSEAISVEPDPRQLRDEFSDPDFN